MTDLRPYEITGRIPMSEAAHRVVDAMIELPPQEFADALLAIRAWDAFQRLGRVVEKRTYDEREETA